MGISSSNQSQLNSELESLISFGIVFGDPNAQLTLSHEVRSILEAFLQQQTTNKTEHKMPVHFILQSLDCLNQLRISLTKKICQTSNQDFSDLRKDKILILSGLKFVEKSATSNFYHITAECVTFLFLNHFDSVNFIIKSIFDLHSEVEQKEKEEAVKFINTILIRKVGHKSHHTPKNPILQTFLSTSFAFGLLHKIDFKEGKYTFCNTGVCYQYSDLIKEEKYYFVENSMKIYFLKKNKLVFRTMEIIYDILHFEDIENNGAHNFVAICVLSREKIKANARCNKDFCTLILNFLERYSMNELNSIIKRKLSIWCNY
eukprot:GAHX01002802.1.p1 GENE.GAHX01002802.1~~GAHX01002802.1.p1  ORF type:complete len:317 (-),score=55.69 GAHX01002802.1:102-1052(-)